MFFNGTYAYFRYRGNLCPTSPAFGLSASGSQPPLDLRSTAATSETVSRLTTANLSFNGDAAVRRGVDSQRQVLSLTPPKGKAKGSLFLREPLQVSEAFKVRNRFSFFLVLVVYISYSAIYFTFFGKTRLPPVVGSGDFDLL